jgi:glycosyltransferase involved in cell wall biosynthesis
MNFKNLKIGYVPYLPDLSQPGDRRRFPYFAKRNDIHFEIADKNKRYDVILLTASSNLSQWLIYKKKHPETKFIFEMVDSLIFPFNIFNTLFKGIGWFLLRKETLLYPNHRKLVIKWLKTADLVLCASTELKNIITQWNPHVMVSPDYLEHEYEFCKTNFSINGKMKLVWEGQGIVLRQFLHFKDVFKRLSSFCELHVITSQTYPRFGKIINNNINKILRQLPIETIFHKWDLNENYKIFSQCDCGIIPLNKKSLFAWHKPGNKLVSFWFTGIPTVASSTPAYTELMENAGENWYCDTNNEWIRKIEEIKTMPAEKRKQLALQNLSFVRENFSDEALDRVWFEAFESILKTEKYFFEKN